MGEMVRFYIRQSTDQEYTTDKWKWDRKKQIFKPIGWMCLYCKSFRLDEEYSKYSKINKQEQLSEEETQKQDAPLNSALTHVQEANAMHQQEEDVRIEEEIGKQLADITTNKLKKYKYMNTFERKAQNIRLKLSMSPITSIIFGTGRKFKRRQKVKYD